MGICGFCAVSLLHPRGPLSSLCRTPVSCWALDRPRQEGHSPRRLTARAESHARAHARLKAQRVGEAPGTPAPRPRGLSAARARGRRRQRPFRGIVRQKMGECQRLGRIHSSEFGARGCREADVTAHRATRQQSRRGKGRPASQDRAGPDASAGHACTPRTGGS